MFPGILLRTQFSVILSSLDLTRSITGPGGIGDQLQEQQVRNFRSNIFVPNLGLELIPLDFIMNDKNVFSSTQQQDFLHQELLGLVQ